MLFAFRYACVLLFVLAVWYQARRVGAVRHPLTWLICLLGVLMSQNAAYIKPEIFSYVFMTLTVLAWLRIKSEGENGWRTCYLFPLLMLLWVNSHGGFIFGAVFLFILGLGEALNLLLSPEEAIAEAKAYFGEEGQGLIMKEQGPCCAYFEGAGGFVRVTASQGDDRTKVDLETREWGFPVKSFMVKIG